MKRLLIATIIGAVILFICQFLSWAALNLHSKAQGYTPQQESIMALLKDQNLKEGGYILPSLPPTASQEEWNAFMKTADGKPWASIQYHNRLNTSMAPNMIRTFLTNIVLLFVVCWLLVRLNRQKFSTIFTATVLIGLVGFINFNYIYHIWYKTFDLWGSLAETVITWSVCGLWLGWWLTRNTSKTSILKESQSRQTRVVEEA